MPSSMIHLLAAHKYRPQTSTLFMIGSLAPDCVSDRVAKDRTHLRDRADRLAALRELAGTLDMKNDFCQGVMLHLFTDLEWDMTARGNCKWDSFAAYHQAIGTASAWLYHHMPWSSRVWADMATYPPVDYALLPDFHQDAISDFINRNAKWHTENMPDTSGAYTPDYIENFTSKAAAGFSEFIKTNI